MALPLLADVILTVKLATKAASGGFGWGSSSAVIYEGTCHQASQIATGLHILVNIVVMTLVATSSYCNQVLAAPSRARINVAHAQRLYPMGYLGFIATVLAVNVPRLSSSQSSLTWVGASSVGPGVMVMPWLIVVVAILILMFRRFKSTAIPIAMNYSAVISAACHPPPDDIDVAEIQTRCCRTTFTSKDVVEPRSQFFPTKSVWPS
ncbi:Pc13g11180 [Penicillium rubens Wisconsin 54-1255]|uniref:Pc13g11180 protein n=1 Tax=Penicillium rubens (strain ATCC 28089 / DSM 1075 / NRRL 1951 / Wisconsin 54-1255) TaxID=500485 RepID=B6H4W1_PENRW|nr:Pc13g11180 [Penicillium rubens Wisconsin 54-1255]